METGYVHIKALNIRAEPFHHACTFVPEAHVRFQVMFIRAAEAAVGDFEEDLLAHESVPVGRRLHELPTRRAFVDRVVDAVGVGVHVAGVGRSVSFSQAAALGCIIVMILGCVNWMIGT